MKILVIEDDNTIIENIILTLQVGWQEAEVLWSNLGEEGIDLIERHSPDLIILDIGLPDISGFELIKRIRLFSEVPIVVLTVEDLETSVVKALEFGADEYVIKPFRQMELLARLKAIARKKGGQKRSSEQQWGPFIFNFDTHAIKINNKSVHLTNNEFKIFHYLANNKGCVLTYPGIAEKIWGCDYPGSIKAIRVYIRQLREKIEENPKEPKIILTKSKIGYYLA